MRRFQNFYKNNRSSFFNYNVVVWSSAGLLTLIIFLVDQFADTDLDNPYTPAVGVFSCWIYSRSSTKSQLDYNNYTIFIIIIFIY